MSMQPIPETLRIVERAAAERRAREQAERDRIDRERAAKAEMERSRQWIDLYAVAMDDLGDELGAFVNWTMPPARRIRWEEDETDAPPWQGEGPEPTGDPFEGNDRWWTFCIRLSGHTSVNVCYSREQGGDWRRCNFCPHRNERGYQWLIERWDTPGGRGRDAYTVQRGQPAYSNDLGEALMLAADHYREYVKLKVELDAQREKDREYFEESRRRAEEVEARQAAEPTLEQKLVAVLREFVRDNAPGGER